MAIEMFVRFDGVTGQVTRNFQHRGWAELSGFSWAADRVRVQRQSGTGQALRLNEITLVKPVGVDSPALMQHFVAGTRIASADISVVSEGAKRDNPHKLIAIHLRGVLIRSITAEAGDGGFRETVVVRFAQVRYVVNAPYDPAAGTRPAVAGYTFDWDPSIKAAS